MRKFRWVSALLFVPIVLFVARNSPTKPEALFSFPIAADYALGNGFGCTATYTGYTSPDCFNDTPYLHTGIDFLAEVGTPVFAVSSGTVIYTGQYTTEIENCGSPQGGIIAPQTSYNLQIQIQQGDKTFIYLHLSEILVNVGDELNAGTMIGLVGVRGCGGVPHLHFGVQHNGHPIDPMPYLQQLMR